MGALSALPVGLHAMMGREWGRPRLRESLALTGKRGRLDKTTETYMGFRGVIYEGVHIPTVGSGDLRPDDTGSGATELSPKDTSGFSTWVHGALGSPVLLPIQQPSGQT